MKKTISLPTQLLIRDAEIIKGFNLLIVGAPEPEGVLVIQEHLPATEITLFNYEYDYHLRLKESVPGAQCVFDFWYTPRKPHDAVVLYLPKSEALIAMTMSMINGILSLGGKVYVVGHKNAGIKSQKPSIEKYIGAVEFSDAARHSVIYQATMKQSPLTGNSLESWAREYNFELGDGEQLPVTTLPGVFSHGKLDEGTRMLLEVLDIPKNAKVLDWGCGSGIIGLAALKISPPAHIEMVDSNALALAATKLTMEANGLPTENIHATNIFSDVKDTYDLIVSNPPFHSGIETKYDMVEQFIRDAKAHLSEHGQLLIVANSFLRYAPLVKKAFGNCITVKESKSYKVYKAVKTD